MTKRHAPRRVGGSRWDDAAKLVYALGPDTVVTCVGEDSRGFAYVGDSAAHLGKDVVLVVRRRSGGEACALTPPASAGYEVPR